MNTAVRPPRIHDDGLSIRPPGTSDRPPSDVERFLIETNDRTASQVSRAQAILYRLVGQAPAGQDEMEKMAHRPCIADRMRTVAARVEQLDQLMAHLETII